MIWIYVVLAGLFTSVMYAKYIRAVSKDQPGRAAVSDFCLMLMGSLTTQAWFVQHQDFRVFLLFDAVAAIGTYWAVKHSRG